ncbi:hypothetical protein N9V27_01330 [bacterium]|nr:hypothetical protein [bacterium]
MFYYYNVYAGTKHIDLVRAISEQDAINQVYMKFGGASRYTGYSADNFVAIRA